MSDVVFGGNYIQKGRKPKPKPQTKVLGGKPSNQTREPGKRHWIPKPEPYKEDVGWQTLKPKTFKP